MTYYAKFYVPVRVANIVPSILLGQILANIDNKGKFYKAVVNDPNITTTIIMKVMSSIPQFLFHLLAKQ